MPARVSSAAAVPPPTPAQLESKLLAGLNEMAKSGYVAIHEAGHALLATLVGRAPELGIPVKLIGVGEGLEDLRPFDPTEFAHALLDES